MKHEDIKLPGVYTIDRSQVFNFLKTVLHDDASRDDLSRILGYLDETANRVNLIGRLSADSLWYSFQDDFGNDLWVRNDWILSPASEPTNDVQSTGLYCDCVAPSLVQAFSGIAAQGEMYHYCRSCKRERL